MLVPFAAVPTIAFQLQLDNAASNEDIHTIVLRCQIQIEVTRRGYSPGEQARLLDLFGHPQRWGRHCAICCGCRQVSWFRLLRVRTRLST